MSALRRIGPAVAGVVGASTLSGCAEQLGLSEARTEGGETVRQVFDLYLLVAYVVGAIVVGLIVFVIWRDRRSRRGDGQGSQRHHNFALEITYTIIPLIIVAALTVVTLMTIDDVADGSSDPDLTVQVEAYQWGWRFTYPDGTVVETEGEQLPQLVLPARSNVAFDMVSYDVIHSFWVPGFRFKLDIIPGRRASFTVATTDEAVYEGKCAEYCGLQHATMQFTVRTVGENDFSDFLLANGASS